MWKLAAGVACPIIVGATLWAALGPVHRTPRALCPNRPGVLGPVLAGRPPPGAAGRPPPEPPGRPPPAAARRPPPRHLRMNVRMGMRMIMRKLMRMHVHSAYDKTVRNRSMRPASALRPCPESRQPVHG